MEICRRSKKKKEQQNFSIKLSNLRLLSSKPSRMLPSTTESYVHDFTPACLVPQSQTLSASVKPYHLNHSRHLSSLPRQINKNPSSRYPSPCGKTPESASSEHFLTSVNPPIIRTVSPKSQKLDEMLLQGHWGKVRHTATKSYSNLRDSAGKGVMRMASNYIERPAHMAATKSMQTLCKGAAFCDIVSSKFDAVVASIDDERFSGREQDLFIYDDQQHHQNIMPSPSHSEVPTSNYNTSKQDQPRGSNYFSKVWLYSNSRLPPHLPPFKVYTPTYPLLCLAATYSERVYTPPKSKNLHEIKTHIPADWRSGTKAMVIKAVPVEDLNTIVFAIRGSQTFMDWAINYNSAPSSPENFLEDAGNLCHAGFLYVARKMIKPVADRLRVLLQENPARSNYSLLITGHSAGGAVAALLYAHMMSATIHSELSYLGEFFKRIHCITFGAPPLSLRALQKPGGRRHRKSLFYSFINEGDPIPRADKNMLRSLLKLYTTPAPSVVVAARLGDAPLGSASQPDLSHARIAAASRPTPRIRLLRPSKTAVQAQTANSAFAPAPPAWPIPPCTLLPAGRLVVLRQIAGSLLEEDVEAVTPDEAMLRNVVYGDLLKHQMSMYKRRIDSVAIRAVTGNAL